MSAREVTSVCRDAARGEGPGHTACTGCGCPCHAVNPRGAYIREVFAQARAERRVRGRCAPSCGHRTHHGTGDWQQT